MKETCGIINCSSDSLGFTEMCSIYRVSPLRDMTNTFLINVCTAHKKKVVDGGIVIDGVWYENYGSYRDSV